MARTVRPARRSDIGALRGLQEEFRDHLRQLGDESPGLILSDAQWEEILDRRPAFGVVIAEVGGEVVGYLCHHEGYDLDRGGPVVYVFDLFVREAARGGGVGRALMAEAGAACAAIGGREILFDVWKRNAGAVAFYARLGAVPVQELQYMHLPIERLERS